MVLVKMREHDRVEMPHVVTGKRGRHPVVEPGVDQEGGGAVGDEDRVRLAHIHDADPRRGEATPPHIRDHDHEQRRGERAEETLTADPWPKDEQRDAQKHRGGKKHP